MFGLFGRLATIKEREEIAIGVLVGTYQHFETLSTVSAEQLWAAFDHTLKKRNLKVPMEIREDFDLLEMLLHREATDETIVTLVRSLIAHGSQNFIDAIREKLHHNFIYLSTESEIAADVSAKYLQRR